MEDAIDEWIIRQINWLRREDVIVQGIRWIQDVRRHIIPPFFFLHWIYLGSLLCFSLKFDISFEASVALFFFLERAGEVSYVSYVKERRK
jgi:hypothetical protein